MCTTLSPSAYPCIVPLPVLEVALSRLSSDGVEDPEAAERGRSHRSRAGHEHLFDRGITKTRQNKTSTKPSPSYHHHHHHHLQTGMHASRQPRAQRQKINGGLLQNIQFRRVIYAANYAAWPVRSDGMGEVQSKYLSCLKLKLCVGEQSHLLLIVKRPKQVVRSAVRVTSTTNFTAEEQLQRERQGRYHGVPAPPNERLAATYTRPESSTIVGLLGVVFYKHPGWFVPWENVD